jgi:hypothetical protein
VPYRQEKLYQELQEVLGDGAITDAKMAKLKYLKVSALQTGEALPGTAGGLGCTVNLAPAQSHI